MSRKNPLPPRRKRSPFFLSKAAIHGRIPMEPSDLRAITVRLNTMAERMREDGEGFNSTLAICSWVREHLPKKQWIHANWRMFIILDFLADNEAELLDIGLMRDLDDDGMCGIYEGLIDALATVRFTKRTNLGARGVHYGIDLKDVLRLVSEMRTNR